MELWTRFSPSLLVSGGSGPARKLGETGRNRPVIFWSVSDHRSPRNDQKRVFGHFFEFSSGILGAVWLLFKVLSCLESSGRVVGFISAHFRLDPTESDRVMTKNVKKLTTKKATTIYM